VYAKDKTNFDDAVEQILAKKKDFLKFVKRFEDYLKRKEEWAIYARLEICLRGHDTNNFAEASIKIMKEAVMQRMRAFNPVALIEFIIGPLEDYYKRRLLDHAYNRHTAHTLVFHKLLQRVEKIKPQDVVQIDDNLYQVPSAQNNGIGI